MSKFQSFITKMYYSTGEISYNDQLLSEWMIEFSLSKSQILSIIRRTKRELKGFFE